MEQLFDLSASRAPRWVTLVKRRDGSPFVRVHARVPMPEELSLIRGRVRAELDKLKEAAGFADEAARNGASMAIMAREVGVVAITEWEGVGIDTLPAPITPENVRAVLSLDDANDAFWDEFVLPVVVLPEREKKASPNEPPGTSAADKAIAADAPKPDSPAPGASASMESSAPTANTPP